MEAGRCTHADAVRADAVRAEECREQDRQAGWGWAAEELGGSRAVT
jgi:hypothetical protein